MTSPAVFQVESTLNGKVRTQTAATWRQAIQFAEEEVCAGAAYVGIQVPPSVGELTASQVIRLDNLQIVLEGLVPARPDAIRGGL